MQGQYGITVANSQPALIQLRLPKLTASSCVQSWVRELLTRAAKASAGKAHTEY